MTQPAYYYNAAGLPGQAHVGIDMMSEMSSGDVETPSSQTNASSSYFATPLLPYQTGKGYPMPMQSQGQKNVIRRSSAGQIFAPPANAGSNVANHYVNNGVTLGKSENAHTSSADAYRMTYGAGGPIASLPSTPQRGYSEQMYSPQQLTHRQSASFSGALSSSQSSSLQSQVRRGASFQQGVTPMDWSFSDAKQASRLNSMAAERSPRQQQSPSLLNTAVSHFPSSQSPLIQMSPAMSPNDSYTSPSTGGYGPSTSSSPAFTPMADHTRLNSYSPSQYSISTSSMTGLQSQSSGHQRNSSTSPSLPQTNTHQPYPMSGGAATGLYHFASTSPSLPSLNSAASYQPHQHQQFLSSSASAGYGNTDLFRSQSQQGHFWGTEQSMSSDNSPHVDIQRSQSQAQARQRGFRRMRHSDEIRPMINPQPRGRRADPIGGFISVSQDTPGTAIFAHRSRSKARESP